jgi:hypothetical protein
VDQLNPQGRWHRRGALHDNSSKVAPKKQCMRGNEVAFPAQPSPKELPGSGQQLTNEDLFCFLHTLEWAKERVVTDPGVGWRCSAGSRGVPQDQEVRAWSRLNAELWIACPGPTLLSHTCAETNKVYLLQTSHLSTVLLAIIQCFTVPSDILILYHCLSLAYPRTQDQL